MTHWAHINIWPDELINLQREIAHHPDIQKLLANHPVAEWEVKLAEIALYCEVIVDGHYEPEEIKKLCGILERKLKERRKDNRSILIIS